MEGRILKRNQTIMSILGVLIFAITFVGITYACYSININSKSNIVLSK